MKINAAMFNLTKKRNNQADAAEASERHNAALKKIDQLETELSQSRQAQYIMSENVKNCLSSLYTVQNQIQAIVVYLDHLNQRIFDLTQENSVLKSSGDVWLNHAIKLEFDALAAKDALKKVEDERDAAVIMIERLRAALIPADKKNINGKNQN